MGLKTVEDFENAVHSLTSPVNDRSNIIYSNEQKNQMRPASFQQDLSLFVQSVKCVHTPCTHKYVEGM